MSLTRSKMSPARARPPRSLVFVAMQRERERERVRERETEKEVRVTLLATGKCTIRIFVIVNLAPSSTGLPKKATFFKVV